jgi:VanZ like family
MNIFTESKNHKTWRYIALSWAVLIFIASSIPSDYIPIGISILGWDKIIHMVLYAILSFFMAKGFWHKPFSSGILILFCVAYGISDELHQLFVPGRYTSIYDVIADTIGSGLGILIFKKFVLRKKSV